MLIDLQLGREPALIDGVRLEVRPADGGTDLPPHLALAEVRLIGADHEVTIVAMVPAARAAAAETAP